MAPDQIWDASGNHGERFAQVVVLVMRRATSVHAQYLIGLDVLPASGVIFRSGAFEVSTSAVGRRN